MNDEEVKVLGKEVQTVSNPAMEGKSRQVRRQMERQIKKRNKRYLNEEVRGMNRWRRPK